MHDLVTKQLKLYTLAIADEKIIIIPMYRAIQDILYVIEK